MVLVDLAEDQNQVVEITNPSHKYYGEKAVIQMITTTMYKVRLLNKIKDLKDRFIYNDYDRVEGTTGKNISLLIRQNSVRAIPGQFEFPLLFPKKADLEETSKLLKEYHGKTRMEVENSI